MRDEVAEQKRAEVIKAAEAGELAGPLAMLVPLISSSLLGLGASIGDSQLTRALAPPKVRRDAGRE